MPLENFDNRICAKGKDITKGGQMDQPLGEARFRGQYDEETLQISMNSINRNKENNYDLDKLID